MTKRIKEQGFTLIEIIAVLIILGILALIAIPKYQDIVDQAKESSINQALAEGQARLNQAFADCLLFNNGTQANCDTLSEINSNNDATSDDLPTTWEGAGDYDIQFTNLAESCNATVAARLADETSITKSKKASFCAP